MKKILLLGLATGSLALFSACEADDDDDHVSHVSTTTTTEERLVAPTTATETRTVRTY